MKLTKLCHGCKQSFRRNELIDYASPGAKTMYSYCSKCLEEKHSRENFSNKVCSIFGIKTPGPLIWTQRKRLQDTYGYTDDIIIECLDYLYNVQKTKKLVESLGLITPENVEKMLKYKQIQQKKANKVIQAMQTETKNYIVPIKENDTKLEDDWNPDEWLIEE